METLQESRVEDYAFVLDSCFEADKQHETKAQGPGWYLFLADPATQPISAYLGILYIWTRC